MLNLINLINAIYEEHLEFKGYIRDILYIKIKEAEVMATKELETNKVESKTWNNNKLKIQISSAKHSRSWK